MEILFLILQIVQLGEVEQQEHIVIIIMTLIIQLFMADYIIGMLYLTQEDYAQQAGMNLRL